ncbi:putative E3 ubiquitin-protein ligase Zswim2 [Hypsibius exemplaris]|uniref:E3 ubiquitin-protein ligase Zswim2 n=1 Tax=Hypsibius exemplaris TaxID=2072580 RepID=A0A1W0WFH8_HYPEX|nr:putative E3 ubiquitin-protein ligase Zswim2 [Hypsibius exemplaris]
MVRYKSSSKSSNTTEPPYEESDYPLEEHHGNPYEPLQTSTATTHDNGKPYENEQQEKPTIGSFAKTVPIVRTTSRKVGNPYENEHQRHPVTFVPLQTKNSSLPHKTTRDFGNRYKNEQRNEQRNEEQNEEQNEHTVAPYQLPQTTKRKIDNPYENEQQRIEQTVAPYKPPRARTVSVPRTTKRKFGNPYEDEQRTLRTTVHRPDTRKPLVPTTDKVTYRPYGSKEEEENTNIDPYSPDQDEEKNKGIDHPYASKPVIDAPKPARIIPPPVQRKGKWGKMLNNPYANEEPVVVPTTTTTTTTRKPTVAETSTTTTTRTITTATSSTTTTWVPDPFNPISAHAHGASYLGGYCKPKQFRCSIVYVNNLFSKNVPMQIAHEIMNSIGVRDDGDQNNCKPAGGEPQVMSHEAIAAALSEGVDVMPVWSLCARLQVKQMMKEDAPLITGRCLTPRPTETFRTVLSRYQDLGFGRDYDGVCGLVGGDAVAVGNREQVSLGETHQCDCPAFRKTQEPCLHICWLLMKKFKVRPENEMLFQKGLNESYLKSLFSIEKLHESKKIEKRRKQDQSGGRNKARVLTRDDECPICFDKFFQSLKGITQCSTCSNHVHIPCRNLWKRNGDSDTKDRCPYCRGNFGAGSPVHASLIPWKRSQTNKAATLPMEDSVTIHKVLPPSFTTECIKGYSLGAVEIDELPSYIPSSGRSHEWQAGDEMSSSFIQSSTSSLEFLKRPRLLTGKKVGELTIAGRGLPQFNSCQEMTGPTRELACSRKPARSQRSVPNALTKAVSAIRHNQQVGTKGPTAVLGLAQTLGVIDIYDNREDSTRTQTSYVNHHPIRNVLRQSGLPVRTSLSETMHRFPHRASGLARI